MKPTLANLVFVATGRAAANIMVSIFMPYGIWLRMTPDLESFADTRNDRKQIALFSPLVRKVDPFHNVYTAAPCASRAPSMLSVTAENKQMAASAITGAVEIMKVNLSSIMLFRSTLTLFQQKGAIASMADAAYAHTKRTHHTRTLLLS